MIASDTGDERHRLALLYAGMGENELQELAQVAGSLTDLARQVLRDELSRRNLKVELQDSATAPPEVELRKLVTVRDFRMLPDALLAKGILESAGIECFLSNDILIRMDWLWSNLLGGVKLRVKPEDVEAATHLLDRDVPTHFNVEGVGEYEQPRCPRCHSLDVSFKDLDTFGIPISADCYWECQACSHRWQDSQDISA